MSEEILIQNLDPDEVVVLDPDNSEELLLGVDSIVILPPSSQPLVTSVNGQTGPVVLGATDVDADPAGTAALLIAQITAASLGAATALQGAKADAALAAIDAPAAVRDTALTGLSTATATPVVPTDTVLEAAGKLQAQATDNAAQLLSVRQKTRSTWYQSGLWYGTSYPLTANAASGSPLLGRAIYLPMQILESVTFNAIGLNVITASAAGGTLIMGVFECLADGSLGNALFVSNQISTDTTGSKEAALNLSFTAGAKIYVGYLSQGSACTVTTSLVSGFYSASGAASTAAPHGIGLIKSGQTVLGDTVGLINYSASAAMICLKAA